MQFLLSDEVTKHLYDHEMQIRFEPFFQDFVPEIPSMPFKSWHCPKDLLSYANDERFHDHLVSIIKQADSFYFIQHTELRLLVDQEIQACCEENISLDDKDWHYIDGVSSISGTTSRLLGPCQESHQHDRRGQDHPMNSEQTPYSFKLATESSLSPPLLTDQSIERATTRVNGGKM